MKRNCSLVIRSKKTNRAICVDSYQEDIIRVLLATEKYRKKSDYIFRRILEQPKIHFDDYKIVERGRYGLVTEMRLFPNGDNGRVYCIEKVMENNLHCIIIAAYLEKKKSQRIDKRTWQLIEKIKHYDYEFQQEDW
jgi:hypothetical protein